ncbi:acyl-CoA desaturase, partial [Streptomyces sp. NPDC059744]
MNPSDADRAEQAVAERDAETAGEFKPLLDAPQTAAAGVAMWIFVVGPPICLIAAALFAWGWGLSVLDVGMAVVAYLVSGFGLTVGYHRLFTHRSFKARRGLRIALAVAGSLGVEGSPVQWVA